MRKDKSGIKATVGASGSKSADKERDKDSLKNDETGHERMKSALAVLATGAPEKRFLTKFNNNDISFIAKLCCLQNTPPA